MYEKMSWVIHKKCAKKDAKLEINIILIYRSINGDGSKDLEKNYTHNARKTLHFF